MDDKQLAEIEARANSASGPKLISGHLSWAGENAVLTSDGGYPVTVCGQGDQAEIDARFFAAAREDVPALLAEAKGAARVRKLHSSRTLTEYSDDARQKETGHTWDICEACTDPDIMGALDDGELIEESETASWPCATIDALNGGDAS